MDFNITEYENFIEMLSDSTLLLTFRKLLIFEFGCSTKNKTIISEKTFKQFFRVLNFRSARDLRPKSLINDALCTSRILGTSYIVNASKW